MGDHKFDDGEIVETVYATCTENGYTECKCTVHADCGKTYQFIIPATGHTDGEWITDVNATCTEDGSKHQICSICNVTLKTEVIVANGHI